METYIADRAEYSID